MHNSLIQQVHDLLNDGYEITLQVTSVGDPFASPFYWNFLKDIQPSENFKVRITTNGTLMTRDRLAYPYAQKIDHIDISVDAFTELTYNKVRRGGNFTALRNNLVNLNEMVLNSELSNLKSWGLNFVVQTENYKEMVDFTKWALSFNKMNRLWFLLIYNWGHLSADTFSQKAVWKEQHPEHHKFLEVLKDPIFDNNNIVMGNLTSLRKKALEL